MTDTAADTLAEAAKGTPSLTEIEYAHEHEELAAWPDHEINTRAGRPVHVWRSAGGNELSFFTKRRLQKALKANSEPGRLQLGALAWTSDGPSAYARPRRLC